MFLCRRDLESDIGIIIDRAADAAVFGPHETTAQPGGARLVSLFYVCRRCEPRCNPEVSGMAVVVTTLPRHSLFSDPAPSAPGNMLPARPRPYYSPPQRAALLRHVVEDR